MNSEEVISLYETVAVITDQMLAAAREGNWERLAELESRCASCVATLKRDESSAPLSADTRQQKARIIQRILADDREIRTLTEPWMNRLSAMIGNIGNERKLSQFYDLS
jgi:flagellar protein FliT